ncbi:MAG: cyclase [Acidimicrobiia bacterium]|nr:cyclase [Acidimicrobiia bacterium]
MVRMFVRHEVDDYTDWREAYDAFDAERRGMGVRAHGVYRGCGDANDVTVSHDFDSVDAARSFVESTRLKEAMEEAGVRGEPQIWFVEQD